MAKRLYRKGICIWLCLVLLLTVPCSALGAEGIITAEANYYSLILQQDASWSFEYSDRWFEADADTYHHAIARASLGLSLSAFRAKTGDPDRYILDWMQTLGFTQLSSQDYDQEPSIDTISTMIGQKQLPSGETLLAVAVCGQGYKNEWLSNLDIGDQPEHRGFSSAAQKVAQRVEDYIQDHNLTSPRLWLSGFSRAGAVANLTGAKLMEKGLFTLENAFIYTFATPNATRNPVPYPNMFNIVGKFDPVARIPFQEWGFGRHGCTLYTPAQETDSDYRQKRQAADVPFYTLTGRHMWNDPVMNHHLTVVEAFLLSNVPTAADYDTHMREPIAEAWTQNSLSAVYSVLNAMRAIALNDPDSDEAQREMVSELLDYTFSAAMNVLDGNETFIELAETGLVAPALLLEHMPDIYLAWMFSSDEPQEIFSDSTGYTQLVISGDAQVNLFDGDGGFLLSLEPEGNLQTTTRNEKYLRRMEPEEQRPLILAVNSGEKLVFILPGDQGFPFTMVARENDVLQYYGIHYDIHRSAPTLSSVRLLHMHKEEEYLAFSLTPYGQAVLNADERLWGDAHEIIRIFDPEQLLSVSDAYRLGGINDLHFSVRGSIRTLIVIGIFALLLALDALVGVVVLLVRLLRKLLFPKGKRRKTKSREDLSPAEDEKCDLS